MKERKKERGRGVSDGPWRTFRLLRSGIDVPVQAVTVGCILLPYLGMYSYIVSSNKKKDMLHTLQLGVCKVMYLPKVR